MTLKNQIAGCLFGGALGDALAAPFENAAKPHFIITASLQITDDTQLTMATCEGILQAGCVEPQSIAKRFADWYRARRISGVGASTLKALIELAAGGHWAMTGASGERAAGNGAAMRIAPLAFFLDPNISKHRQTIRDVCRITHRNDESYLGGLAILFVIRYENLDRSMLDRLLDFLPDSQIRDRLSEIVLQRWGFSELVNHNPPTGFVVDSVPAAILAAIECESYMETIGQIVEAGGDTDTTAAMFGNIIGWHRSIGHRSIGFLPMELARKINEYSDIDSLAQRLTVVAENQHKNT